MVQVCATRCSCIAILWIGLVSFAAITLCVVSWVFVVVYFVIIQSGNFWIYPRIKLWKPRDKAYSSDMEDWVTLIGLTLTTWQSLPPHTNRRSFAWSNPVAVGQLLWVKLHHSTKCRSWHSVFGGPMVELGLEAFCPECGVSWFSLAPPG
jgi:hypothetical protein